MSLKSFYYKQEDRYFNFLDNLEKKGLNLYKIVDPLEKNGIPTFAIFNLIILAIIVLIVFSIIGHSSIQSSKTTFSFMDSTNNPIINSNFVLSFGDFNKSVTTNEQGIADISGLQKKVYSLRLIDNIYNLDRPTIIDTSENKTFNIYLTKLQKSVSKTIYFKKNNELLSKDLVVSKIICTDNSDYSKENITVENGTLILDDVPADCGTLEPIIASNIDLLNDSENLYIDNTQQSQEIATINLSAISIQKGSLNISVIDSELETPIPNVTVTLSTPNTIQVGTLTTNENGIASFDNLPVGNYLISLYDNSKIYGEISIADNEQAIVSEDTTETKVIKLKKEIIGTIKFKVVDSKNSEPIEHTAVTLYKGTDKLVTNNTDENGFVEFGLKENVNYNIQFDNEYYQMYSLRNIKKSNTIRLVKLIKINTDNQRALIVSVVGDASKPVEFANVQLFDTETNTIVKSAVTNIAGKVVFVNLDPNKQYKVQAIKGKFKSNLSNPFRIYERQDNKQIINMKIGEGTYNLKIVNEFGAPVATTIYVYDYLNNIELQDKKTMSDDKGNAFIKVRADKLVYFVVNNFNSKFVSVLYNIDAGNMKNILITLPKVSNSSNIKFIGYFDSNNQQITSVSAGQIVNAKFIVNVNQKYNKVVAHIRTGQGNICDNKTHSEDSDDLYIQNIMFAGTKVIGSKTYTPCNGESTDFKSSTGRDGKWFNAIIDNPLVGSYEVVARIVVLDDATGVLPMYYRAEFYKVNSIFRYPIDSKLLNKESTFDKQGLYAYSKEAQVVTGNSNFCTGDLCYNFSMYNDQTKIIKQIINSYTAQVNTTHKLYFNLNVGNKSISNPVLKITAGNSIFLKNYNMHAAGDILLNGTEFDNIDLKTLNSNDHISGTIDYDVVGDQQDVINFSVISDDQVIFNKQITMNIKSSKKINLDVTPKSFIPFINNDTMLLLTDDSNKPISNADIIIKINNQTIKNGTSDSKGLYGFILPAPGLGDTVEIIIQKSSYETIDSKFIISNKLLKTTPDSLVVNLDPSKVLTNIYNFSITNNTALPLAITSIKQTGDNKYVTLKINPSDNNIDGYSQMDLELHTTLTSDGLDLMVQKNIKTNVVVTVTNSELSKTWNITIPIMVRIKFGNALDSLDCLVVDPNTLEIRSGANKEVEYNFKLKNNCTVSNQYVSLNKINAQLDWGTDKEVGNFSLYINNKKITLENSSVVEILNRMDAKQEIPVKLIFKAYDIKSAERKPTITFKSKRVNLNAVDNLESTLNTHIIINKYTDCLVIPKTPVPINACSYTAGFGNYNSYYQGNRAFTDPRLGSVFGGMNQGSAWGNNYAMGYNPNRYFAPGNNYNFGNGYVNQSYSSINSPNFYEQNMQGGAGGLISTIYPYGYPNAYRNNGIGYNNQYTYNGGYTTGQVGYDSYNYMKPAPYGINQYGNGMIGCAPRMFTIENNCAESVDIKLQDITGVTIKSDKTITIDKDESAQVSVAGTSQMGIFQIPVKAKPTADNDASYKFVANVPVSVSLPLSYMPSQCITVTPKLLDFSNIVNSHYQDVKIINKCFDKGYRIVQANILDLQNLSYGGITFLAVANNRGSVQPIKVTYPQDPTTGQKMEMWDIALRRNPQIMNTNIVKDYLQKYNTGSEVSTLITSARALLFNANDRVNLKFILQIGLQTPELQNPLVYDNEGMELRDNFQWLMFDNAANWNMINGNDNDVDYPKFVSITDGITYTLKQTSDGYITFINVPDKLLTADQFKPLDLKTTAEVCVMGKIYDFPIQNLPNNVYIPDTESSYFNNNNGPIKVSISYPYKGVYKLCFERPTEEIKEQKYLKVYDVFSTVFDLLGLDSRNKEQVIGKTLIGVSTNLGSAAVTNFNDNSNGNNSQNNQGNSVNNITCSSPDGKHNNVGFTGINSYKSYGFDKLLFKWNYQDISSNSCDLNHFYCGQEQLYMSISKKINNISNNDYVDLNGILFMKNSGGSIKIVDSLDNIKLTSLCDTCTNNNLKEETNINDYLTVSKTLLSNIPSQLQELTIITVTDDQSNNLSKFINKFIGNNSNNNNIYKNGNNYSFTVKQYLDSSSKWSDKNILDNIDNLQQFYTTMNIGVGDSINVFFAKLKKLGDLSSSYNKFIMSKKDIFNKYTYTLDSESITNISAPGVYLIKTKLNKDNVTLKISNVSYIKNEFGNDFDYSKNALFYNPINPNSAPSVYNAPFLNSKVNIIDYYNSQSNWNILQNGYTFVLNGGTIRPDIKYMYSKPAIVTNSLNNYSVFVDDKSISSVNKKYIYLLNQSPQKEIIQLQSDGALDLNNKLVHKFIIENGKHVYNLNSDLSNYLSDLDYSTVLKMFSAIKNNNVCFSTNENNIKLWTNLNKLK